MGRDTNTPFKRKVAQLITDASSKSRNAKGSKRTGIQSKTSQAMTTTAGSSLEATSGTGSSSSRSHTSSSGNQPYVSSEFPSRDSYVYRNGRWYQPQWSSRAYDAKLRRMFR